nr:integrase, catalytic region, zinc finger, CCHC-type, peptidase aspartic, catalytic [Tanacetum cinerariifolium]
MAFLSAKGFHHQTINSEHHLILEIKQPLRTVESSFNKFKEDKIKVMMEKLMLAEAQEAGQTLDEEQLSFLANPSISEALCSIDKNIFEIQIKQLRIDNDQLLNQIMSQEIVHIVANSVDILDVKKLKNNMEAHEVYIEKTIEYTTTLRGFVKRARTQYPSEPLLEFACMFTKHVQELLVYASQPCPNSSKPIPIATAPRAVDIADSSVSTSIDQDAPSSRSSSNVRPSHTPFELIGRWTKVNPIENVIGDPSRLVSTRKKLKTDVMWCYFDAFLTSVELKNFKQEMTEPSWIDAMQEEIHEFKRLQVR